MQRRGRPPGWRKSDPRSSSIMVRLAPSARVWLAAQSHAAGISESEIIRQLIEQRISDEKKGAERMRGATQVGHDAVVVWSPDYATHQKDLEMQLARGCTERGEGRGSFQKGGNLYFSWLNAPPGKCELCGGPCRIVPRR